ncbi:unnamed protein product [Amaranthus hypochondriacus]
MDSHEKWVHPNNFEPNGLVIKECPSVTRSLDPGRWAIAEERTAELILQIQPNWSSEKRRNDVASYVQRLIAKSMPCQVFTFGSVPLKTYLPDGDIDLTAFSDEPNLKDDDWVESVLDMLRREEKNEHAEYQVKEIQYIQAEVKIIKCLVDNIVVDISFNQLGGLCTLCFLEEVDNLINQNHIFKRSIILIKAWCYYESRILGAHHGLISTYALETLVLYIFHVFNNSFVGPLEVLYRFVEFFSKFDWANFCVSLWGPIPICSLPSMAADPPRKDGAELLLNEMFLHACSTAYSVFPRGQENQEQRFIPKHLNVVDPLRINNNLGRSVNKGNFFRIRSAFSFGAQRLARILECQEENIVGEVNRFFVNTLNRHGKSFHIEAPILDTFYLRQDSKVQDNLRKHNEYPTEHSASEYPQIDESHSSIDISEVLDVDKGLLSPRQMGYEEESRAQVSSGRDQCYNLRKNSSKKKHNEKERIYKANILQNREYVKPQFARTSSSPELTNMSSEAAYLRKHNVATERIKEVPRSRSEHNRKTTCSVVEDCVENCINDEVHKRESSSRLSHHTSDSSHSLGSKTVSSSTKPVVLSGDELTQRHEDAQDFKNWMFSSGVHNYGGHVQMPVSLITHPFASISPSVAGYGPQKYDGTIPLTLSAVRSDWSNAMQYSDGPPEAPPYQQFDPAGVEPEESVGLKVGEGSLEVDHLDEDHGLWTDSNEGSVKEIDDESEDFSTASSRLSPASSNSYRTKASSETSWDKKPSKIKNTARYPVKKKSSSSKNPTTVDKSPRLNDGQPTDHTCVDKCASPSGTSSQVGVHQLPGFGRAHMTYPNSMLPLAPLLVHPGSRQGANHNHAVPVAFYPAGPAVVPFVIYNVNAETEISETTASHDDTEMEKPKFHMSHSSHISDSAKGPEQSRDRNQFGGLHSEECGTDIFNSDFGSHWKNLQYGRFCQNSQMQHLYPPPVYVPPLHLQGHIPSDALRSPYPGSPNVFAHLVPVSAQLPGSSKSAGVSRQHDGEFTKHRNGTGTYFPNPKVLRDQQSSTSRQYQGDYKHDRNEHHWERDANWNFSSKQRFSGRAQPRYRIDKPNSKVDRSVASGSQTERRHDNFRRKSYQFYRFPKDPSTPKPTWNVHYDAHYPVNETHSKYHNAVSQSGNALPPLVMIYPYPQTVAYGTRIEPVQFGSVGPQHFVGADEIQEFSGYQGETGPPSPDYASPPRFPRDTGV